MFASVTNGNVKKSEPLAPAGVGTPAVVHPWRVAIASFLMLSWEGVIPAVTNQPLQNGKYLVSAICLLGVAGWAIRWVMGRNSLNKNSTYPIYMFLYCIAVTVISSYIINQYPAREWLFAQYMLFPLLIGFFLQLVKINWKEIIYAFILSALICSMIAIADQIYRFPQFDQFTRGSINNRFGRRMFLMRVETGLSIVMLVSWLLTRWRIDFKAFVAMAILAIDAFVLFRVSESRQSMLTVALAITYFLIAGGIKFGRVIYIVTIGAVVSIPVLYLLAGDYIEKLLSSDNYLAEGNVQIRFEALDFYWNKFLETGGLGFGVLSNGDDATNFFATAWRVGNGNWGYMIADIGIFSPLVQFGWIGLFAVVFLTLRLGYMFIVTAKKMPPKEGVLPFALGAFMLASMINPWPMNYFTLDWTIMFGSLVWFTCNDLLAKTTVKRSVVTPTNHREMPRSMAPA